MEKQYKVSWRKKGEPLPQESKATTSYEGALKKALSLKETSTTVTILATHLDGVNNTKGKFFLHQIIK